jgi:hypothetical protein
MRPPTRTLMMSRVSPWDAEALEQFIVGLPHIDAPSHLICLFLFSFLIPLVARVY